MSHDLPHYTHPNPDSAPSFSGFTMLCMIENWKFLDLSVCREKSCLKISQRNRFKICEKSRIP